LGAYRTIRALRIFVARADDQYMTRLQTLGALLAVILGSLAALPIRGRLAFAIAAVALIAWVGISLLRSSRRTAARPPGPAAADRAAKIRAERARRLGR
jgi:hypothetical protein